MQDQKSPVGQDNHCNPSDGQGAGPELNKPTTISLPKGDGAIRGIGEKFAANAVTGSVSMSVPIATSLGRSGFGPQLYLMTPALAMARSISAGIFPYFNYTKNYKGLPQYFDAQEMEGTGKMPVAKQFYTLAEQAHPTKNHLVPANATEPDKVAPINFRL